MVALAAALLLLAPPPSAEPFPFAPEQNAQYERAFGLMEQGKAREALPGGEDLAKAAPQNPRAQRLLGFLYQRAGRNAEAEVAFTKAIALGIDGARKADSLAMRGLARLALRKDFLADEDARQATALNPNFPGGWYVLANALLDEHRSEAARAPAERFAELQPDSAQAQVLLAAIDIARGDVKAAKADADRARKLGSTESALLDDIDKVAAGSRREERAWGAAPAGLALLAALVLSLLLFWLAGAVLSRLQVQKLSRVDARVLRGEQSPSERLVGRAYDATLWFGTLLFYGSVPVTVALTLGVGVGLLWLVVAEMQTIPVRLIVLLLVFAVGGAWAILRGLFVGAAPDGGGKLLTAAEEPALFAALREVAEVAQARLVDRVHLEADAGVGVREAGGTLQILAGRGERVLHLGFAALRGLTASELKAILAHEYGHFSHGETRLNPVVGRITVSLFSILRRMGGLGWAALVNPVYWYLRLYLRIWVGVTAGHSRRRELLADRAAALAYGGEVFGRALAAAVENGELFDRAGLGVIAMLRESGRTCTDLYACLDGVQAVAPETLRGARVSELLGRKPGAFDSHPPPADRVERVAGIAPSRPLDASPAKSLLRDAGALARELTAALVRQVDVALASQGVARRPPVAVEPAGEVAIAAAIALHNDALELQQRKDPQGDALLADSVQRLAAAAGDADLFLVPALENLARTQLRRGDKVAAEAAVSRAIGILEGRSGEDERLCELKKMLASIRHVS